LARAIAAATAAFFLSSLDSVASDCGLASASSLESFVCSDEPSLCACSLAAFFALARAMAAATAAFLSSTGAPSSSASVWFLADCAAFFALARAMAAATAAFLSSTGALSSSASVWFSAA